MKLSKLVMFAAATGTLITGLDHWSDVQNPKIAGGLIVQAAIVLSEKKRKPKPAPKPEEEWP